jgi:hypothetical protein
MPVCLARPQSQPGRDLGGAYSVFAPALYLSPVSETCIRAIHTTTGLILNYGSVTRLNVLGTKRRNEQHSLVQRAQRLTYQGTECMNSRRQAASAALAVFDRTCSGLFLNQICWPTFHNIQAAGLNPPNHLPIAVRLCQPTLQTPPHEIRNQTRSSKNQLGVTRRIGHKPTRSSGVKSISPSSAARRWATSQPRTRATASSVRLSPIRLCRTLAPISAA